MVFHGTLDLEASARRLEQGIQELARFSSSGSGVTRLSFTPEYRAAQWFAEKIMTSRKSVYRIVLSSGSTPAVLF